MSGEGKGPEAKFGSDQFQEEDRKGIHCYRVEKERHPAYRWAEAGRGERRERGKLGVVANGKAASGLNHESESTDAASSGGPPCSSDEAE